jgi:tetratricopeptide (TPR) repeat protein
MTRPARFILTLLIGLAILVGIARPSSAAVPVCALLDTSKLPVVGLLEARLFADAKATWVERSQLERILKERELQSAFGAAGGEARAALGTLVKANVLVLLRTSKNDPTAPPQLDCVVCETQGGLRLRTMSIPANQNPESVAAALEELIREALQKYGEKIDTVVAVPPFLSEDLGSEFNYLQTAYPKLVEEFLLRQPGLLVVELSEAQAIARELALAGEQKVSRLTKPPLHVVGRYRHDGMGAARTIRMSLRLLQSETQLTLKGMKDLPPREAPAWILDKTQELTALIQNKQLPAATFSAADEARALAARGDQFRKLGSWQEALALYEAALLLQPEQIDVRRHAIMVMGQLIQSLWRPDPNAALIAQQIAIAERGYAQMEAYLRVTPDIFKRVNGRIPNDITLEFEFAATSALRPRKETPAELVELQSAAWQRRIETLLRITAFRAQAGHRDRDESNSWEGRAVAHLSEQEQFALVARMAEEWRELPGLPAKLKRMCITRPDPENSAAIKSMIEQFAASSRPELQAAATVIRQRVEQIRLERAEIAQRQAPPEPTEIDRRLKPVHWEHPTRTDLEFEGSLVAFDGVDLFYCNGLICAMRQKGKLEDFYAYSSLYGLQSHIFDGSHVWGVQRSKPGQLGLVALDAQGKAVEFTAADGIPPFEDPSSTMKIAPVEPGKVLVVGYSGKAWAAIATVNSTGRKFEIILEAREIAVGTDVQQQQTNPHIAFTPTGLYWIRDSVGRNQKIFVGRQAHSGIVTSHPLLIDPQVRSTEVTKFTTINWSHGNEKFALQTPDALYFYENRPQVSLTLQRVPHPGTTKEMLLESCPEGWLAYDQRGVHIIGKQWWLLDPATGQLQTVVDKPAWHYLPGFFVGKESKNLNAGIDFRKTSQIRAVFPTHHYGPLVKVRKEREVKLYQLDLSQPTR